MNVRAFYHRLNRSRFPNNLLLHSKNFRSDELYLLLWIKSHKLRIWVFLIWMDVLFLSVIKVGKDQLQLFEYLISQGFSVPFYLSLLSVKHMTDCSVYNLGHLIICNLKSLCCLFWARNTSLKTWYYSLSFSCISLVV